MQNGGSLVAANTGLPEKMAVKRVSLLLLLSGVNNEDTDGVLDGLSWSALPSGLKFWHCCTYRWII